MSDKSPSFLTRKPVVVAPDAAKKIDPRVNEFLSNFIETGEAVQQQRMEIERQQIEIEKLHARIGYADSEMKRIARARDQFQAQYCELKIALEVIVTTAVSACDNAKHASDVAKRACILATDNACKVADEACQNVIDQARATLAQVKAELVRVGVEPPGDIATPLTTVEEATVTGLAKRLAPRNDHGS